MTPAITSVEDLGRYLRKYRKEHGHTQNDLSKKFKLRRATLSSIENGTAGVTMGTFFHVMTALNLALYLDERPPLTALDNEEAWS